MKLRRSEAGGDWQEVAVPKYPEGATVHPGHLAQPDTPPKLAALDEIWALEPAGPDRPGVLWAGTIPGGLFRSNDRGDSWELVEGLWDVPGRMKWMGGGKDDPGIHSIVVDPRNSSRVVIAISCGGVWITEDDGATWNHFTRGMKADYLPPEIADDPNGQDPHLLVACPASPDHLWVQHHCGIFRSTDGARNWEALEHAEPSGFGFAVAVHPKDPNTAWFVPGVKDECRIPVDAKFVVTRTRDGGESFESLTNGLPPGPAYDVVYRHALDVDETGDRLAMGSTTGSLWTSDDGGDSWTLISANLPPIHCVRFDG